MTQTAGNAAPPQADPPSAYDHHFGRRLEAARGSIHQPLTDAALEMSVCVDDLRTLEQGGVAMLRLRCLASIAAWANDHAIRLDWLFLGQEPMRVADRDRPREALPPAPGGQIACGALGDGASVELGPVDVFIDGDTLVVSRQGTALAEFKPAGVDTWAVVAHVRARPGPPPKCPARIPLVRLGPGGDFTRDVHPEDL